MLFLAVLAMACGSAHHFQNLVVWNQADQPERIEISVDGKDVYSGILGTIDSVPKIVFTQTLGFPVGEHKLSVTVPGRGFSRTVTFSVGKQPVNLHVGLNRDEVEVNVTYGPEAYL